MVSLEKELEEERTRTAQLATELRHAATNSVSDLKAALELEKDSRMEMEALILKKVADDTTKVGGALAAERKLREDADLGLREEFTAAIKQQERASSKFQAKLLDDMDCTKTALRIESEERAQGEERAAQALGMVIHQMQESLQIVSR
eukprot:NODE_5287_length_588_cov_55.964750_g4578_i0.p1 GENE.NODE_5287_length_588_cov_55.964750_g4578_i0~~NODE_5287_length_588_cov_55.964750_g4578_i0.p1  ORF type:complete len:161 (+),score=75.31 NODE_5287_length_588_cov_55.964750_g4578_i0:41-484(+)